MKTSIGIILAIFILGTSSCYFDSMESTYGNGDVVSEERMIEDFTGLKVSSGIDVIMKQGDNISLLLEADENLHDAIKTEVIDNTLKIYTTKNIRKAKSKIVYLVYKDLNAIKVSSAGDVRGENTLRTEQINIDLSSAGDLNLKLEADEVNCDISSSGDVRLSGNTNLLDADLSSAGDLHAFELIAKECRVSCSSAGDARVHASEKLVLRSSSAGSIYYKGGAKDVSARTSSAGSISKR